MQETFISLEALQRSKDIRGSVANRRGLINQTVNNPEFKLCNLTGKFMGLTDDGYPIIEVPNTGAGYSGGARSGKLSKQDPDGSWQDWLGHFDFSLLTIGTTYFFLCVADPTRRNRKGRPIRYPIFVVTENFLNERDSVWSAKQNEICSTYEPIDAIEKFLSLNRAWHNSLEWMQ